jgi:hypothetical protein
MQTKLLGIVNTLVIMTVLISLGTQWLVRVDPEHESWQCPLRRGISSIALHLHSFQH